MSRKPTKRDAVLELIAQGCSNREIAAAMEMDASNVAQIRRNSGYAPHSTNRDGPPKYGLAAEIYQSSALELHQLAMRCL